MPLCTRVSCLQGRTFFNFFSSLKVFNIDDLEALQVKALEENTAADRT
jgi:hypothetical protein